MKIPVLVIAFNRPERVKKVLDAIGNYQPSRLYLACDGPRSGIKGEDLLVAQTKKVMLLSINWDCDIYTLFRDKNLGCKNNVYNAISWFFENEEYGVIIEDDVVVSTDFFTLCEELLPRYVYTEKVMEISAENYSGRQDVRNTYVYSQCFHIWGWATWRRAWEKMDLNMSQYHRLSISFLIKRLGVFRGFMMNYYFTKMKENVKIATTWDTQWFWSILANDGFVIVPGVNLAVNIGMTEGTHYKKNARNPYSMLKIDQFNWPLVFNDDFLIDKKQKFYDNIDFLRIRWFGLINRLKYGICKL